MDIRLLLILSFAWVATISISFLMLAAILVDYLRSKKQVGTPSTSSSKLTLWVLVFFISLFIPYIFSDSIYIRW